MVESLQALWDLVLASGASGLVYGLVLLVIVFAAEYLGIAPTGNARRIALALSAYLLNGSLPAVLPEGGAEAVANAVVAPNSDVVMIIGVLFAALLHEAPSLFAAIKAKAK